MSVYEFIFSEEVTKYPLHNLKPIDQQIDDICSESIEHHNLHDIEGNEWLGILECAILQQLYDYIHHNHKYTRVQELKQHNPGDKSDLQLWLIIIVLVISCDVENGHD